MKHHLQSIKRMLKHCEGEVLESYKLEDNGVNHDTLDYLSDDIEAAIVAVDSALETVDEASRLNMWKDDPAETTVLEEEKN